jgi:hypothetical protein
MSDLLALALSQHIDRTAPDDVAGIAGVVLNREILALAGQCEGAAPALAAAVKRKMRVILDGAV